MGDGVLAKLSSFIALKIHKTIQHTKNVGLWEYVIVLMPAVDTHRHKCALCFASIS